MNTKTNHSKLSRGSLGDRFVLLASRSEIVFHTGDIANLWNIRNTNTLHKTLSRYVAQGLLYRIQKGLYSIKKPADIDPHILGMKALHTFAYVSCETVLFEHGIVNQVPHEITLVSNISKRFTIAGHYFRSRRLRDAFLHNDVGVTIERGVRTASLSRAIADMLYFYPKKYLDAQNIDWDAVRDIARHVGYPITLP